jgi:hypothetical protein
VACPLAVLARHEPETASGDPLHSPGKPTRPSSGVGPRTCLPAWLGGEHRRLRDRLRVRVESVVARAKLVERRPRRLAVALGLREPGHLPPRVLEERLQGRRRVDPVPVDLRAAQRRIDELVHLRVGRPLDFSQPVEVEELRDPGDLAGPVLEKRVVADVGASRSAGRMLGVQRRVQPGGGPAGVRLPGSVRVARAPDHLRGVTQHGREGGLRAELVRTAEPERQEPVDARVFDHDVLDPDELNREPVPQVSESLLVGPCGRGDVPGIRPRVEAAHATLPHQPLVEVHDPARLAEAARIGPVRPHLGLGNVKAEPCEDACEQARAAPADPEDDEQSARRRAHA